MRSTEELRASMELATHYNGCSTCGSAESMPVYRKYLADLTDLLATREKVERLRGLLQKHVDLRETQRKREAGEFHIPAHAFIAMWDEIDAKSQEALKETTP